MRDLVGHASHLSAYTTRHDRPGVRAGHATVTQPLTKTVATRCHILKLKRREGKGKGRGRKGGEVKGNGVDIAGLDLKLSLRNATAAAAASGQIWS